MADFGSGRPVGEQDTEPKPSKGLLIAQVVCLVLALAFAGYNVYTLMGEYDAHMNAMNEAKRSVGEYTAAETEANSFVPYSSEDVTKYVKQASDAGKGLAKAQNGYFEYTDKTDGSTATYAEEVVGKYFTNEGQVDRVPWLPGMTEPYSWSFYEPANLVDNAVPCIWVATIGDDIVGYARGTFDVETGLFSSVEHTLTEAGKKYEAHQLPKTTEDGFVVDEGTEQPNTSANSGNAASVGETSAINRGPAAAAGGEDPVG